jgi:hypothetical protein
VRVHGKGHRHGHEQGHALATWPGAEMLLLGKSSQVDQDPAVNLNAIVFVEVNVAVNAHALVHDQAWPSTCTARVSEKLEKSSGQAHFTGPTT